MYKVYLLIHYMTIDTTPLRYVYIQSGRRGNTLVLMDTLQNSNVRYQIFDKKHVVRR